MKQYEKVICSSSIGNGIRNFSCVFVNEFKPIEVKDLPQAVLDAVAKDYAEFTIKEAYIEEVEGTKTYKVVLTDAEDNTAAVLYTEKGEVLE